MIRFTAGINITTRRPTGAARWILPAIIALIGVTPLSASAQSADSYPTRPVKVLIPYAPGGATDIVARFLASKINEVLGQPMVIENRPGASGNIALEAAAKAAPDGYTLFVGNVTTNAINESTFTKELHIKPSRDLVGITELAEIPHIFAATPSLPANSIADVIALAKASPGKLNFASAGLGSYPQLDMMKFEKAAGVDMTHVPYKNGAAGMITALLTGEVQVAFINLSSTLQHVKAGKMKPLATTAPARLAELPNVPTMAEAGFPGIGTNAWQAIFAPAATPKPIIDKLYKATVQVMSTSEMKDKLSQQMLTVVLSKSPQAWTEQVRAETQKWGDFIRENHITLD
jgi:tripartite-type tricarboxylate transporter receptor subunit TctC